MNRYSKPFPLRYTASFTLDCGTVVGMGFDRLNDAVGFVSRLTEPGEWWEVIDNMTNNTVMSAKDA